MMRFYANQYEQKKKTTLTQITVLFSKFSKNTIQQTKIVSSSLNINNHYCNSAVLYIYFHLIIKYHIQKVCNPTIYSSYIRQISFYFIAFPFVTTCLQIKLISFFVNRIKIINDGITVNSIPKCINKEPYKMNIKNMKPYERK